ncbi:hypothetical protein PFISCL1PPCAC_20775, partial [Pristionchus fissidentatus]
EMSSSRRSFTRPYAGRTKVSSCEGSPSSSKSLTTAPSSSKKTDKVSEEERLKSITAGINQKRALKEKNMKKVHDVKPSSRKQNNTSPATKAA